MFVKLKIGQRAGEIVEMKYMDAKELIDAGSAELAYPPDPDPDPVETVPVAAVEKKPSPHKTKKK